LKTTTVSDCQILTLPKIFNRAGNITALNNCIDIPPHKQVAYKEYNSLALPVTEKLHQQVLSLPISPVLKKEEVSSIVKVISEY